MKTDDFKSFALKTLLNSDGTKIVATRDMWRTAVNQTIYERIQVQHPAAGHLGNRLVNWFDIQRIYMRERMTAFGFRRRIRPLMADNLVIDRHPNRQADMYSLTKCGRNQALGLDAC